MIYKFDGQICKCPESGWIALRNSEINMQAVSLKFKQNAFQRITLLIGQLIFSVVATMKFKIFRYVGIILSYLGNSDGFIEVFYFNLYMLFRKLKILRN